MNNYVLNIDGYKNVNKINRKSKRIFTKTGMSLDLDYDLNVKVLDNKGNIYFKKCNDLEIGDICLTSIKNAKFSEKNKMEGKKAYIIGMLYSFKINSNNLTFNLSKGSVSEYIGDYLYRYFKIDRYEDFYKVLVSNEFIIENNIDKNHVPIQIMEDGKLVQNAFLKGFFDTNSIIYENKIIKDIYSNSLLKEISLMLRNFGVIPEIENYDIFVCGQQIIYFYNVIGTNNIDYEEEILNINLSQKDFFEITILKDLVKDFMDSTKSEFDIESFRLTRLNILNLLELEGDFILKDKLEKLVTGNICFDEIISLEEIDSSVDIIEDKVVVNSFVIKK